MLTKRLRPDFFAFMLYLCLSTVAIEDITDRRILFGVPTKLETDEIAPGNELLLFHEDGRIELIRESDSDLETTTTMAKSEPHAKPLPVLTVERGNERKPIDNFGDVYQRVNESIFHQAKVERPDNRNPYPPLPTIEFNDDPTPVTEVPISKSSLNRGHMFTHMMDGSNSEEDFNSGYRSTTEEHFRRTTTQEPDSFRTTKYGPVENAGSTPSFLHTQQTPPAEGRFQRFREQEWLDRNREYTTVFPHGNNKDHGSGSGEETVPPPPAPDWAVNVVLGPRPPSDGGLEPGIDEPFLVTESLKSAFGTNGGESAEETTERPVLTTTIVSLRTTIPDEIPTMKLFEWEMHRGDVDVRSGINQYDMKTESQNTFTPTSKRRPHLAEHSFDSNSVLMPQEFPDDVDLPRTYEISPRLVLPQRKEDGRGRTSTLNEGSVDLPAQNPPIAPPTLVSAERSRYEPKKEVENELQQLEHKTPVSDISLHTAPKRGGGSAVLVPISTPNTVPYSLETFGQRGRLPSAGGTVSTVKTRPVTLSNVPFTSFTRSVGASLPSIQVNSEDYSDEREVMNDSRFQTLATKPPGDHHSTMLPFPSPPDYHRPGYTNAPGFKPLNAPPGILIVSSPPGFFPNNLVATTTPSYLPKTSTPYFTESLIPKRPSSTKVISDPNREYSPRVQTTTPSPDRTTPLYQGYQDVPNNDEYVNQRVSYGMFGRGSSVPTVAYDPNVKLNSSYLVPVSSENVVIKFQDESQKAATSHPERTNFEIPDARLEIHDPPVVASIVKGRKTAHFFIPSAVRLSMSKAIKLKPFHDGLQPIHTPRHLLQNAVPAISTTSSPFLSPTTTQKSQFGQRTTVSRFIKFRNDQTQSYSNIGFEMRHNALNWVPIGLASPKRLGAVKLVPAHSKEERIEIHPVEDLDAKRSDQTCTVDPRDEFADLRIETRQIARKCFKRAINCLLDDIVPLERRISYTEEQCLNFCGHHPFCRSLVYSTTMSICDIFDGSECPSPSESARK